MTEAEYVEESRNEPQRQRYGPVLPQDGTYELDLGELCLDTGSMTVTKNGEQIFLTPTEYKILLKLMRSPGRVYTKAQIYESINGEYFENDDKTMMVHISKLSDKRVAKVEDVVNIGDTVTVRVVEVDRMGRINLTMRPEDMTADLDKLTRPERRDRGDRPERGDRGGRDRRDRGERRERSEKREENE